MRAFDRRASRRDGAVHDHLRALPHAAPRERSELRRLGGARRELRGSLVAHRVPLRRRWTQELLTMMRRLVTAIALSCVACRAEPMSANYELVVRVSGDPAQALPGA